MAYWTSYIGVGLRGRGQAVLHRVGHDAVQPAGGGCLAPGTGPGRCGLHLDPAPALRAVLPVHLPHGNGHRGGRLPGQHPQPRRHGVDLPQRGAAAVHAHDPEGGPARGAGRRRAAGRGGADGRGAAGRDATGTRAPSGAGGGARRSAGDDRPGRAAAGARHGGREAADLGSHPCRLDGRRRRPRSRPGAQLARFRAARADLRLLPVGRHDRRDPAAGDRQAGGGALRDPVLGPHRNRPAVDDRPAGRAAAAVPRPAQAAAGARRRRRGGHGQRRRRAAQRRGGGIGRGGVAGRPGPGPPHAQLRPHARGAAARRRAGSAGAAAPGAALRPGPRPRGGWGGALDAGHHRRRRGRGPGGPGRIRRAPGAQPGPLRGRPVRGGAAPVRPGGGGRGGLGLQPAAAVRARVRAPEPRPDAA